MGYRKDLKEAKSVSDCQSAYEKECLRLLKKFEKEDEESAFSKMICMDFSVWVLAERKASELVGFDTMDCLVKSKY